MSVVVSHCTAGESFLDLRPGVQLEMCHPVYSGQGHMIHQLRHLQQDLV